MRESGIEAHRAISGGNTKEKHYKEIKRVLKELEKGTCSNIAKQSFLKYHQIQRRMSELEKKEEIEVVGREIDVIGRPMIWALKK